MHFALQWYLSGVSAFGGPNVRNLLSYFLERVQYKLKESGCSTVLRKYVCGFSPLGGIRGNKTQ
jgi:hypothetical protein